MPYLDDNRHTGLHKMIILRTNSIRLCHIKDILGIGSKRVVINRILCIPSEEFLLQAEPNRSLFTKKYILGTYGK